MLSDLIPILPAVNATLNLSCAVLLIAGWLFIRARNVSVHRACMLGAFFLSALFLISYLVYHANAGSTPFPGRGWIRPIYFTILISHVVLAAVVVPFAVATLHRALRGDYGRHRSVARRTLPLWLYVSMTGVAIYVFLYHVYDADVATSSLR